MCPLVNPETILYTAKEVVLGHKRCIYKKRATYKPSMRGIRRNLDIIVKISDHNPDALRRIDLYVYIIELRENQREPTPSEKDDICPICCEEFGTEGEINSLNSAGNIFDLLRWPVAEVRKEGAVRFVGGTVEALQEGFLSIMVTPPSEQPVQSAVGVPGGERSK
ncbi:hypothetical protein YC2023_116035 [Brassica napus]